MFCSKCGQPVRDGAAFCGSCGARVEEEVTGMVCPACGHTAKPGMAFCDQCGARLAKGQSSGAVRDRSGSAQTNAPAELLHTLNPARHYKTLKALAPMTAGSMKVWSDRLEYVAGMSPMEAAVHAQGIVGAVIASRMAKSKQEGRNRTLLMRDIQRVEFVQWSGPGAKMTLTLRSGGIEIFGGDEASVQMCADLIRRHAGCL